MNGEKDLLLASAARLYSLGVDVEAARERLRELVKQGVPYESEEMRTAYQSFTELSEQWKEMEQAHISLRDELLRKKVGRETN